MITNTSLLHTFDVAVIGGGFSGVAVVHQLGKQALKARQSVSCVLFEPQESIGAGIAYSPNSSAYVLNVPASRMSIDDEFPSSFVDWLLKSSYSYSANDFVPRKLYREYLASSLADINHEYFRLKILKETVYRFIRLAGDLFELETEGRKKFKATQVIVAVGNSPKTETKFNLRQRSPGSPWDANAINQAAKTSKVALIGTGLTAVDTVMALEERGFKGFYTLISRKGLLPQPHVSGSAHEPLAPETERRILEAGSLRSLLREIRSLVSNGLTWHTLIDGMRPHSSSIWQRFTIREKQRFIRHLRPFWDSHRHRVPQTSLESLQRLKEKGRLIVMRGRAESYKQGDHETYISAYVSGGPKLLGPFDAAFDCTGLWTNLKNCRSSLIHSMVENNMATYDELFLGVKCDAIGQLINRQGKTVRGIYTLGALRRGELWETTAVREIRQQAKEISKAIMAEMNDRCLQQTYAAPVVNY